jgi:hypothetical protein
MRLTDPLEPLGPVMDAVNRIPEQRLHNALGLGPADIDDEHGHQTIEWAGLESVPVERDSYWLAQRHRAPVKVRQIRNRTDGGLDDRFILRAGCRDHRWSWLTYADNWHHAVGSLEYFVRMHIAEYHRDLNV